jgi:hypothetical protein
LALGPVNLHEREQLGAELADPEIDFNTVFWGKQKLR